MKKILIVDDELPILTGLSKALYELCGFTGDVRTVVNGREAIHEACACFYDVCFLDISLPDINGLIVKNDIRLNSPETNIVFMSARYTAGEMNKIAGESGAFYIDKPFDFYQIRNVMRIAMEGDFDYDEIRSPDSPAFRSGKRKFRRRALNRTVGFCLMDSTYTEYKGCGVDISYAGMGIRTYYPLEQGQIIYFKQGLSHRTGIVAWNMKDQENNCRAGVRFI